MTKQTLRKKLRNAFETVLEKVATDQVIDLDIHSIEEICELLADAGIEQMDQKPAYDKSQADPAWEILFGSRTQEQVDETKLREDALNEFMRALSLPASFNWYPNRKAEETAMATLRNLVVEIYRKDKTAFTRYETWRNQPFSRGAISNATIRSYPEKFVFSWSDFERSEGKSNKSTNNSQIEVDDNGIPRTY